MDPSPDERLSRTAASEAVSVLGWRFLLDTLVASVAVTSLAEAAEVGARVVAACGADGDDHLRLDLRPDRVELFLRDRRANAVTGRDTTLAALVSDALQRGGRNTAGATGGPGRRPVQQLELAIDAMDIDAVRPFWRAVMAYGDEAGLGGPTDAVVDPAGELPAIWFQQMDEPRTQRNRIHLDLTVTHDEADSRIAAALAAGGRMMDASAARSFWILADAEGNEVCICTWQDRDGRD